MAIPGFALCARCLARSFNPRSFQASHGKIYTYRLPKSLPSRPVKRHIQSQQFKPFVPPSPSSLPKAAPPKTYRRTRKWSRRLVYLALGLGATYEFDQHFFYASLTRSARTFWLSLIVATDYKINFRAHPLLYDSIQDLHLRNAERLFDLLRTNGGLYLKIGQAIAMQVDADFLEERRPSAAEPSLVSYPAPGIPENVLQDVR